MSGFIPEEESAGKGQALAETSREVSDERTSPGSESGHFEGPRAEILDLQIRRYIAGLKQMLLSA